MRPSENGPNGKVVTPDDHQLLLYAQDFRRLLELERGQRQMLQNAYRETVVALARALESKQTGIGGHSERVRRYATELTQAVDPRQRTSMREAGLSVGMVDRSTQRAR